MKKDAKEWQGYILEEALGNGTFGDVIRVRDGHAPGRVYALKRIKLPKDKSLANEVLLELVAGVRLAHESDHLVRTEKVVLAGEDDAS